MPIAPVAIWADAERFAHGGIHAVSSHHEAGLHDAAVAEPDGRRARPLTGVFEAVECDAETHVSLRCRRKVNELRIQLGAPAHARKLPAPVGEGQPHNAPARRAHARRCHRHPRVHPLRLQAE